MTKKVIKIVTISLCVTVLICSLSLLVFLTALQKSDGYVRYDESKLNDACFSLKIVDNSGNELTDAMYFGENKQVPLSSLHKYTYMAFVSVEDKRFFSHRGIDLKRVGGAVLHNVKSGGLKEGASTITQQLIKNTHLDNGKNFRRKVNEMLLALQLEKRHSKEEILEMYLNTIYFGRNAYGIENAANVYFDKKASDLTVAESALLAGMIKAPNSYAPDKNVAKCRKRRDTVLSLMRQQGVITDEEYSAAINETITYIPYHNTFEKTYVNLVLNEAENVLKMSQQQLLHSKIVIETYCEPTMQSTLYGIASHDETLDKNGNKAEIAAVICDNQGKVLACYFRGEGAMRSKQIGSTAKPIAVYTPALCEKLITQASPVLDEPTDFSGYKPTNANGYNGWTTVKNAVIKSLNIPAVKTLNTLGLETAKKYLGKMGFYGEENLSLALGNIDGGMTVLQLAKCYATLANNGVCNEVSCIKQVKQGDKVLYKDTAHPQSVFDAKSTYLMTDMLKCATKQGTARALGNLSFQVAAKTGTVGDSEGNSVAVVAGYTTSNTFVFRFGGELPNSVNGATAPCQLADKVLKVICKEKPADFTPPQGVVQLTVDKNQLYGNQLVKLSESGEKFWFDVNNKPTEIQQKEIFRYTLTTEIVDGQINLVLPVLSEGRYWKIYRVNAGEKQEIFTTRVENGEYFAELWQDEELLYTTPKIIVKKAEEKNFWDFWLLPSLGK